MHISSTQESRGTMETLCCLLAACHRFEFSLVNFLPDLVKVRSAGALGLVPEKEELTLGIAGVGLEPAPALRLSPAEEWERRVGGSPAGPWLCQLPALLPVVFRKLHCPQTQLCPMLHCQQRRGAASSLACLGVEGAPQVSCWQCGLEAWGRVAPVQQGSWHRCKPWTMLLLSLLSCGFALGCSCSLTQVLGGSPHLPAVLRLPQLSLGRYGCSVLGACHGVHCTDNVLAVCYLQVDEEGVL